MSRTERKVCPGWDYANPYGRDKKPFYKPDSKFKTPRKRARRAKARNAFRTGREVPRFRHTDEWDFL